MNSIINYGTSFPSMVELDELSPKKHSIIILEKIMLVS